MRLDTLKWNNHTFKQLSKEAKLIYCFLEAHCSRGDYDFILVKGTHKKRAHGKLKVSDKAKDYYRVGILKSGMHTAVLKEINSTCECFSKEVILEEFEAYFKVLEMGVFHEVLR